MSNEQIAFSEAIVADLGRLFPHYPPTTSNAAACPLGQLLTITMPAEVARSLIDAFIEQRRLNEIARVRVYDERHYG